MTLLDRVAHVLDTAGIDAALIGAAALAAAGIARSTFDVDLLTADPRALDEALWSRLREGGADVEVRRGDADDPLAGVVRVAQSPERPVDLVVGRFDWQRRAVDRARPLGTGLRVVEPRDLVLLKLFAGGAQDLWDVRQLLDLPQGAALAAGVDHDLADLPADARARWTRVRETLS